LIIKALSPVLKEESAAAHYGDSMVITIAGQDKRTNSPFLYVEPTAGGWGAFFSDDGQSGLINNSNGDFDNLPVEIFEEQYPLLINNYGFRENSGGAGQNRGGLGVTREYELVSNDANLYLWFERSKTPAWGLFGGKSGAPPEVTVLSNNKKESMLKVNAKPITKGDRIIAETGGGGGFGHPFDRSIDRVKNDVIDGYIDKDVALNQYGVVFNEESHEVDVEKSKVHRLRNRN